MIRDYLRIRIISHGPHFHPFPVKIVLTRAILFINPLRSLSCLLFSRADSVNHYDSNEYALHRVKGVIQPQRVECLRQLLSLL